MGLTLLSCKSSAREIMCALMSCVVYSGVDFNDEEIGFKEEIKSKHKVHRPPPLHSYSPLSTHLTYFPL